MVGHGILWSFGFWNGNIFDNFVIKVTEFVAEDSGR